MASRACGIAQVDALALEAFGLDLEEARFLLLGDGKSRATGDPKGFWRVDKEKDPGLRQPVLALAAFTDLHERIRVQGGDRDTGVEAFLRQNDGEGWLLPETLRLADYGLGHDERANEPQPVASRLGARFYDWQLAQSAEEPWRECHLHARNLLGEQGYSALLDEIGARRDGEKAVHAKASLTLALDEGEQPRLW